MISTTTISPLFLLLFSSSAVVRGSIEDLSECTSEQQMSILPTMLGCAVREEVVQLDLPNETYVHIVPNHVTVNRCGGSCHSRYQSCIPSATRIKTVDVLLLPHSDRPGATPSECAVAHVEEHTACACGCRTSADSCNSLQTFVEAECRCECGDADARAACLSRGRYWNPRMCQCMCRDPTTFPRCPTGYHFDGFDSCSCVNYSEYASTVLEILVLVLVSCLLVGSLSVVHCYRQRTLLFERAERRESASATGTELRTLFRQISQGQTPGWLGGYSHIGGDTNHGPSEARRGGKRQHHYSADAAVSTTARLEPLIEHESKTDL